MSVYTPQDVI